MQNVMISGKPKLCFVLADGDVNKLVIVVDTLLSIDYHRLTSIESKGGSMLRHMFETTLDNGVNALVCYKDLISVIPKEVTPVAKAVPPQMLVETAPVVDPLQRGRKKPGPKPKVHAPSAE